MSPRDRYTAVVHGTAKRTPTERKAYEVAREVRALYEVRYIPSARAELRDRVVELRALRDAVRRNARRNATARARTALLSSYGITRGES